MADSTLTYERYIESAAIALASGDHANAERALHAAIQAVEDVDESRLELATALIKLGTLKVETSQYLEAEEYFRRALEISEHALGSENLGLVQALKGLGTTRVLQGRPQDAEPLLTRALSISERHLGEDHPDLVILLNDLTRLYLKQSAHAFAEPLLLRLLEMKRSKGEDHPEVATVLASLAAVRQALGRHEAAEQLWRRVLSIRERTLAPNHFSLATTLEQLGQTCVARGKVGEALHMFQRALTIREATLGRDHASLRGSRERIADLELQASEDSFEPGLAASPSEQARPMSDEELGLTILPPARRVSQPPREAPVAAPARTATPPRAMERIVPAPVAVHREAALTPVPVQPEAYLDALKDIGHELESEGTGARGGSLALFSMRSFLEKRRAAAIVGVSVITLPLAAWAVVGAARASQTKWVTNAPVAEAPQKKESVVLAGATLADLSKPATDPVRDSAAAKAASRPGDKSTTAKPTEAKPEAEFIRMPAPPSVFVRMDSSRGSPTSSLGGESAMRHLASSVDLRGAVGVSGSGAPQRARMIGALPTPKYPAQQLRGRTGGEVRVRFDVDTLGRPVMSSFAVVGSPLAQLVASVREVIPTIRFEPARSPWPESRKMVETVELAFQFAPPSSR